MKISKRDQKLLLYSGGILTLLLVFFLVYQPTVESNDALKAENAQLEIELTNRLEHEAKKEEYRADTEEMRGKITETLSCFPAAVKEEDIILYANELEKSSGMKISDINIGASNQVYALSQEKYLFATQVGYTFTAPYQDFKKVVKTIQDQEEQRNVENVILSFDAATGKLVGSMTVNFYSMTGTETVYQIPSTGNVPHGTSNIFGTVSSMTGTDSVEEVVDSEPEE